MIKEHKRCLLWRNWTNNIAVHHMRTEHSIDWDNATCLAYTTNYFERIFLERWYTNAEKNSINVYYELPATYSRLVANERQTRRERKTTRIVTPAGCPRQVIIIIIMFINHKSALRRYRRGQRGICGEHFYAHFCEEGHNVLEFMFVQIIDITDVSEPTGREAYWIEMLKCYSPLC